MDRKLGQVRDWAAEAHKSAYKVEAMAKKLGLSSRQLRREIQKHFQVSAKAYLRALQVNTALNVLLSGDPIKTVAAKACYKTVQHFTREFKLHLDMTPSDYLKKKKPECPF